MKKQILRFNFFSSNLTNHKSINALNIENVIDKTLETFFFTKNISYVQRLFLLFTYEFLFKNLQKHTPIRNIKLDSKKKILNFSNKLLYNKVKKPKKKKITKKSLRLRNQIKKKKFFLLNTEPKKIKNRTFGYLFFRSVTKAFNKGGQLKKSLQKIVTGVLSSKKITNSKKLKKAKFSTLFFVLLKKINPLYHNRRFNLGRKTFIIPEPLYVKKKKLFAARWLKKALKNKKEIFLKKFPLEFLNIFKGRGDTLKLKQENINLAKKNFGNINRKFYKKKRR